MQKLKTDLSHILEQAITFVELAIAFLLVILVVLGFGYLGSLLLSLFQTHVFLSPKEIHGLLDAALVLFLVIELFRIAMAYVAGKHVLGTVIAAAFVAVARKIVLYDFSIYKPEEGLLIAVSLALLLLALAATHLAIGYNDRKHSSD